MTNEKIIECIRKIKSKHEQPILGYKAKQQHYDDMGMNGYISMTPAESVAFKKYSALEQLEDMLSRDGVDPKEILLVLKDVEKEFLDSGKKDWDIELKLKTQIEALITFGIGEATVANEIEPDDGKKIS